MKFQTKRRWQIIRQYIIGWTFAFIFISIVRGEGTKELGSVQFELWKSLLVSVIAGPLFGALSGYAQVLTEEKGYKKMSIQKLLGLRVLSVLLFLVVMITSAFWVFGHNITYLDFAFEPGSFAIYFYMVVVEIMMFIFRQVNLFLGSDNFYKLMRGKFYTPKEEERIFMFLDLKASTTHAERLGHIKYSKLIQDCFNDIGVVIENEAEIYQYVGDEIILTWEMKEGIKNQNCINAYFNFQKQLLDKEGYYYQNYECLPHFKAGIHGGIVTVTEVGKYKKEIAYHGDTINIAARIQGKCNDFGKELLLSEALRNQLINKEYSFEELGEIPLKGKVQKVQLYALSKN